MKAHLDITLVGAGVAGLVTALSLARCSNASRLQLSVIDAGQRPALKPGDDIALRVSAISAGSVAILRQLGVWSQLAHARCSPYDHMRVWDESKPPIGPATLRFDADEFAVDHLGYIIENDLLTGALCDLLEKQGIALLFDSGLERIESTPAGQTLTLADGSQRHADLLVAADGANSKARSCAGIAVTTVAYDQVAVVTHVNSEQAHGATAWQRFLRDGPLGMLPLADGRVSVVWSTNPAHAETLLGCSDDELGRELTVASDSVLGNLTVAGPRGRFPLLAQHAQHYVQHGLALVGDAAHSIHPLAGQGANLGIADAACLAATIDAALENNEFPADRVVLRRYERARKTQNALMLHFLTGLNQLFASDSQIVGDLRRAGMMLFNRSGPVRRHVAGFALGTARPQ